MEIMFFTGSKTVSGGNEHQYKNADMIINKYKFNEVIPF